MIKDGVQEMDLVMNIGKFKSGDYAYILDEIKQIVDITGDAIQLKVIIEIPYLTDDEIKKACELCIIGKANFVKTGTGWADSGSDICKLRLIKAFVGKDTIKVKAAGGIKTLDSINEMKELGIDRFGIGVTSAVEIMETFNSKHL
jgi:deoxyribose-phosphate aldolase